MGHGFLGTQSIEEYHLKNLKTNYASISLPFWLFKTLPNWSGLLRGAPGNPGSGFNSPLRESQCAGLRKAVAFHLKPGIGSYVQLKLLRAQIRECNLVSPMRRE